MTDDNAVTDRPDPLPDRGTCVISIDTELAWGRAHRRDAGGPDYGTEREVIGHVLDLFDRYRISATWAVVGHLFLDRCTPGPDGRPHPDLLRPDYAWLGEDWLAVDPGSDRDRAPAYYGRDIVEMIRACPVHQELGSHSFSHVIADDPGCSPEVFASELAASRKAAAEIGVTLRSFVYPRNAVAHVDSLADAGFVAFRGRPEPPFADARGWRRRTLRLVDRVRPLPGSAARPTRHPSGPVNVPQTYFFAPDVRGRHLPPTVWARFPAARVRQAARERSLFHLWFHPYNVTAVPERALTALEAICRSIARERERGRLEVRTMGQVATLVRA